MAPIHHPHQLNELRDALELTGCDVFGRVTEGNTEPVRGRPDGAGARGGAVESVGNADEVKANASGKQEGCVGGVDE